MRLPKFFGGGKAVESPPPPPRHIYHVQVDVVEGVTYLEYEIAALGSLSGVIIGPSGPMIGMHLLQDCSCFGLTKLDALATAERMLRGVSELEFLMRQSADVCAQLPEEVCKHILRMSKEATMKMALVQSEIQRIQREEEPER